MFRYPVGFGKYLLGTAAVIAVFTPLAGAHAQSLQSPNSAIRSAVSDAAETGVTLAAWNPSDPASSRRHSNRRRHRRHRGVPGFLTTDTGLVPTEAALDQGLNSV